jgi:hypothetical protein
MAYNSTLVGTATPGASGSVTGSKDTYINYKFERDQNIGVNGQGYYPNVYIQTNLYTDGDKAQPVLYLATTGEIYKGPYYLVATGDRYTGTFPNSNPNSPVKNSLPQVESDIFLDIKPPTLTTVKRGEDPRPYKPVPNHIDYIQEIMFRHFAKKANDNVFIEIGASTYQLIIDQDPSINYIDWDVRRISWTISSIDPYDVYFRNKTKIYQLDTGTYDISREVPIDFSGGTPIAGPDTQFKRYPDPPGTTVEPLDKGAERNIKDNKVEAPKLFADPWPGFKEWFTKNEFYPYFWKFRTVSNKNEGPSSTYSSYGSTLNWDIIWAPNTRSAENVPTEGFTISNLPADFKYFTEYWVDVFTTGGLAALGGSTKINPSIPIWKPLTTPTNIRNSKEYGKIKDYEIFNTPNRRYITAITNNTISISKKNTYANTARGTESSILADRERVYVDPTTGLRASANRPEYYDYEKYIGSKFYFIPNKPFSGATPYSTETILIFQSTDQDRFIYANQNPPTQVYKGPFFRTTIFANGGIESLNREYYSGYVPAFTLRGGLSLYNPASGVDKTELLLEAPKTEDDPTKDYNTINAAGTKTIYTGFYHLWKKPNGSTEYYTGIVNTPTSQRLYITPKSTTP